MFVVSCIISSSPPPLQGVMQGDGRRQERGEARVRVGLMVLYPSYCSLLPMECEHKTGTNPIKATPLALLVIKRKFVCVCAGVCRTLFIQSTLSRFLSELMAGQAGLCSRTN